MNKRFINVLLVASLVSAASVGFTSCKDYDDDINNLQTQIDGIKVTIGELQEKIAGGAVITAVTPTADGINITLSDGKTYGLTNGKDGANGTTWTIGTDGYWYKDGVKTDYKAIGVDGAPGAPGATGATGATGPQGDAGIYYVPNPETGCFDIYKNGQKIESTTISWRPQGDAGITAVYSGNKLILTGVNGDASTVEIAVGTPVGSIAFVPSVVDDDFTTYPTTDKPFYHIVDYLSEAKYNTATKAFIPQTDWDKSNVVAFNYRLNPNDAYVANEARTAFVDRIVTSRATGDANKLLTARAFNQANGEMTVDALVNARRLATNNDNNVAALQLWNGQDLFTTSDYVYIESNAITPVLADSATMAKTPGFHQFYNRTQAIVSATAENSAFIQQFCGLGANANAQLVYNDATGLDLTKLPGLYVRDMNKWLTQLGFYGMSYKFSLPAEYKSNDAQQTNQQWFVKLTDDNHLVVNADNLTEGLTPAIGRTPVVRVDAFLEGNDGAVRMVASAYIKVEIVREPATPPTEQDDLITELATKEYEYHSLTSAWTMINQMNWMDVNNAIYGKTGLTSSTFWNSYGGANDDYKVELSVTKQDNTQEVLASQTGTANTTVSLVAEGVSCEATLGDGNTQTANIKFSVNNKVKTQNQETYKDFPGKGAEYTVTITIASDNTASRGNVKIVQKFYVRDDCVKYDFNPNFYAGTVDGKTDVVITKGKIVNSTWALEMNISEVFAMRNGQNIFSYFNTVNNAAAIKFMLDPDPQTGISYVQSATNGVISLTAPLTATQKFAGMKYIVTLVNGEDCKFFFNILFQNPFVTGDCTKITLDGNEHGTVTRDVKPSVLVVETGNANQKIFSWNTATRTLELSGVALNTYKVATPTVKYEFVRNAEYNTFVDNLDPASTFAIDATTGIVTYQNLGATLIPTYNLTVKATVTFANLSQVECLIPFEVKGQR